MQCKAYSYESKVSLLEGFNYFWLGAKENDISQSTFSMGQKEANLGGRQHLQVP